MKKIHFMAKALPLALLPILFQGARCQIPDSLQKKAPISYEKAGASNTVPILQSPHLLSMPVASNAKTSFTPDNFSPKAENIQPAKKQILLDSAFVQKLRLAFLGEVNKLRKEGGKTSSPKLNGDYSQTAQDYAQLLSTLPMHERGHYATNIQKRLRHLQMQEGTDPFSIRECIHSHVSFASISDTAAMLEEARISARALFNALTRNNMGEMVRAHRQILNGNISDAGIGISINAYITPLNGSESAYCLEFTIVSITGNKKK